jgi:hypothetical protein
MTAHLTILYSSPDNNLTHEAFPESIPVWLVNTSSGSFDRTSSVTVSASSFQNEGPHIAVINYTIIAGAGNALYLVGFPSTCRNVLLNVGDVSDANLPW